ncbi:MAG: hypothetical protein CME62_00570 [Halobacteriovoraceae bacterium]|nr:hypothetical protein [Halobacteriovoraceae bacterium]|tara:strand:+ start:9370 stop:9705 length:336 start_codon:yes stop_codon:yes gene_type:complete
MQKLQKLTRHTSLEYGIYLRDEIRQNIRNRILRLRELAPSNSNIRLSFKMPFNKIKGILTINSFGKSFKAEADNTDPTVLFDLLEDEIKKQLNKWKSDRFSESHISDASLA